MTKVPMNNQAVGSDDPVNRAKGATRPLISVVVPTFHRADYLKRCVESVLAEEGDYFELIVGDDASPDNTREVLEAFENDPRFTFYRNEQNLGLRENNRKIVQLARGDYIFILTDDDYMLPGGIKKVKQIIDSNPDSGYIISHLPTVDERTGKIVDMHRTFSRDMVIPPGTNITRLLGSAWVLSRQVLKRDLIDWKTWDLFQHNIFFPIIVAGRILLQAPCYYIADTIVMHTWFNKVYWDAFGRDDVEIQFNLFHDKYRCMRAIFHDTDRTGYIKSLIRQWEAKHLRTYLFQYPLGFSFLINRDGVRESFRRLFKTCSIDRCQVILLCSFPFIMPFVLGLSMVKRFFRNHAPSFVDYCRRVRIGGNPMSDHR